MILKSLIKHSKYMAAKFGVDTAEKLPLQADQKLIQIIPKSDLVY